MNKNLDKLKHFFRSNKTNSAQEKLYVLNETIERELRKENSSSKRTAILRDLGDIVLSNRLEEYAIQKLWALTSDLILPDKSAEFRHATLTFYTKLIQGQYRDLSMMRTHFFRLVQCNETPMDLPLYLQMLKALTDNGRDIQNFEEEIGMFMLKWMDQIIDGKLTATYLELVVNIIKFNTAYIDREIVIGLVQRVCNDVCLQLTNDRETFLQCLYVIETVICYTVFPNEILAPCIIVLCRAVNSEAYLETSYKIMRNLLGTQLGYASLLTMTSMLNDNRYYVDAQVLRGAIFHINMNLWGGTNNTLQNGVRYSSTVLSSYLKVLQSDYIIVTYEVIISMQTLISKSGRDLSEPTWDIVLDILESILANIERDKVADSSDLVMRFHIIIDIIEALIQENKLNADIEKIYSLIEKISRKRPEPSVIKLVAYKVSKISPTQSGWLKHLSSLMDRFYRNEQNQSIRIVTIEHLKEIFNTYRVCYEDEILEKVIIVTFSDIALEHDVKIRVVVSKLLLDVCSHCDSKRCLELLDILEKVLSHPFDVYFLENVALRNENEFEDSMAVVNGLIDLFLEKLYQLPSNHAVKIYYTLISHLEAHYQQPKVFEHAVKIRYTIINWMLKIRANAAFQIGYPAPRLISDNLKFTYYLVVEGEFQHAPQTPGVSDLQSNDERSFEFINFSNVATLSIKRSWEIIVKCLLSEKDWPTVQLVLRELPKMMQNKTLVQGNDVDTLTTTLVELFKGNYTKEMFFEHFTTTNDQKDFRSLMIPAVASLITYNSFLSTSTKKKVVEVLKSEVRTDGNLSICVQAFTTLLFEKCDIFERQLADIILIITKVSDTVNVALPILEFLSTLVHLPYSFTNLSQKQFSYVFATCLPYTSPSRYDHYIVSLAHHIIASWFLKSRIQWRKGYADYIIEGIAKNIDKSLNDAKQKQSLPGDGKDFPVNEDSSLRKRSSSLTEQSSRRREINNPQVMKMKQKIQNLHGANKFDMHSFHIELIETCIDFMARNTFSLSSALPRRIPAADFLLRGGGQTKTWIVGNNVVSITCNACMDNHDSKSCACFCSDWAEITIRKPSSMVSWIMKFENQVGLFSNDFSFHDLTALFSDRPLDSGNPNGVLVRKRNDGSNTSLVEDLPLERSMEKLTFKEDEIPVKIPLQSTASDSSVFTYQSQPINIPSKHEAESAIVDDDVSYNDEDSDDPKRNPVRRVNSSPEMRSNWKMNMSKSSKDSKSSSKDTISDDHEEATKSAEGETQQKKKSSYSKETKVSCEAIPEEIITAGQKEDSLTEKTIVRPVQLLSSISAQETPHVATVPKKQLSADDTFQLRRNDSNASPALQSTSKIQEWGAGASSNLPLSPRYGNKHSLVTRQVSHQSHHTDNDDPGYRARSKTISVIRRTKETNMTPGTNSDFSVSTSSFEQPAGVLATSGINPSFVFVQLFGSGKINNSEILPVPDKHLGTLNILDHIPPYEIHKIGILYVGQGQSNNEVEILRNRNGSLRYTQFLHNLGSLIAIKDAKEKNIFVNMEAPREGNFTYVWADEIIQMTFHVATLMPTLESDPNCNEKKKYIGNDYASIVYNESGEDYSLNTIKGQFNYACIIVQPLEMGSNLVSVRAKGDIEDYFKHLEPMVISDRGAPLLARQLALHANMASLVSTSLKNRSVSPYANNWLERLRKIKHLKNKLVADTKQDNQPPTSATATNTSFLKDVFTKYT